MGWLPTVFSIRPESTRSNSVNKADAFQHSFSECLHTYPKIPFETAIPYFDKIDISVNNLYKNMSGEMEAGSAEEQPTKG